MTHHARYAIRHLLLGVVLLALGHVQVAHAQSTASGVKQWSYNNGSGTAVGTWFNTYQAACNEGAARILADNKVGNPSLQSCDILTCSAEGAFSCRLNPGTFVYNNGLSSRTSSAALPCPSAGTTGVRNFTIGWTNDPTVDKSADAPQTNGKTWAENAKTLMDAAKAGTPMCATGGGRSCSVTINTGSAAVRDTWISTTPNASGLYRESVDMEVTYSGSSCTTSPLEQGLTDAAASSPTCDGVSGTVNGKAVCVPSTSRNTVTGTNGLNGNRKVGNPTAGSDGNQSNSGRIPSTGTGTNAGGPATSTDGTPFNVGNPQPSTASTSSTQTIKLDASDIKTDCQLFPNSIGCSEYGTPDSPSLNTRSSGFNSITPVAFSNGGTCPPPLTFNMLGRTYSISYQPICDGGYTYIRPIVLILGAALAAFVFVGGFRS